MNILLKFTYYLIASSSYNISTNLEVKQDSVSFYVYDQGYIKCHVDSVLEYKHIKELDGKDYIKATFTAHYQDLQFLFRVNRLEAVILVTNKEVTDKVIILRNKP